HIWPRLFPAPRDSGRHVPHLMAATWLHFTRIISDSCFSIGRRTRLPSWQRGILVLAGRNGPGIPNTFTSGWAATLLKVTAWPEYALAIASLRRSKAASETCNGCSDSGPPDPSAIGGALLPMARLWSCAMLPPRKFTPSTWTCHKPVKDKMRYMGRNLLAVLLGV